jgi:hypothetical protein
MIVKKDGSEYIVKGPVKKNHDEWDFNKIDIRYFNFDQFAKAELLNKQIIKNTEKRLEKVQKIISEPIQNDDDYLDKETKEINKETALRIISEIEPEEDQKDYSSEILPGFPVTYMSPEKEKARMYASILEDNNHDKKIIISGDYAIEYNGKILIEYDNSWWNIVELIHKKNNFIVTLNK